MMTRQLSALASISMLFGLPAQAHMPGDSTSLGFPPKDYFEEHADEDFVPAALSVDQGMRLRGVVSRLQAWDQGKTLKVCFLSGSKIARVRVMNTAREWTKWAAINFDSGTTDDPTMCDKSKKQKAADIKIGFVSGGRSGGYWSYLGKQSLEYAHSMNLEGLGKDKLPAIISQEKFRGIVLHEFGHALGLEHEHQSPDAKCEDEFDWKAIYAWGKRAGWSKATVDFNFRRLLATKTERRYSAYDPKSVMHYSLPVAFFKKGRASKCYVDENTALSDTDKTFIAKVYPAKPELRKGYTDFLMAEFRGILKEAGLPSDEIARREKTLAKQFNITAITAGDDVIQTGDIDTGDKSPVTIGTEGNVTITIGDSPKDQVNSDKKEDDKDDQDKNKN